MDIAKGLRGHPGVDHHPAPTGHPSTGGELAAVQTGDNSSHSVTTFNPSSERRGFRKSLIIANQDDTGPRRLAIAPCLGRESRGYATVRKDEVVVSGLESAEWDRLSLTSGKRYSTSPEYFNIEKIQKTAFVDQRVMLMELLEKVFGIISRFKTKDELLKEEFSRFVAYFKPEQAEANRKLIERMEKKIQATIAHVWGEKE